MHKETRLSSRETVSKFAKRLEWEFRVDALKFLIARGGFPLLQPERTDLMCMALLESSCTDGEGGAEERRKGVERAAFFHGCSFRFFVNFFISIYTTVSQNPSECKPFPISSDIAVVYDLGGQKDFIS